MTTTRRFLVLIVTTLIGLFASRTAKAFGWATNHEYVYAEGQTVLWEHDKAQCPRHDSLCFVLFPEQKPNGVYRGTRVAQLSRPTRTPWALVQDAGNDAPQWAVYDLRSKETVFTTADETAAKTRFTELSGEAPEMMNAVDGAPRPPVLWRSTGSLLTDDAPCMAVMLALFLFPISLPCLVAWVMCLVAVARQHGPGTKALAAFVGIVTSPLVAYILSAQVCLAFS